MFVFKRIVAFVLLLTITIPYFVLSFSNGAGTCDVTLMRSEGHGDPLASGVGDFSLAISNGTTSGSFTITLKGPKSIKGVLIYTQDSKGDRMGDFVVPSDFQSKSCGGSGKNTLTHKNSNKKSMPINFTWNPPSSSTANVTVRALVVVTKPDWYQLNDLTFDANTGVVDTSAPTVSPPGSDSNVDENKTGFFQQYTLFIVVIVITAVLYIIGSLVEAALRRQQVKARVFAKTVGGFGQ